MHIVDHISEISHSYQNIISIYIGILVKHFYLIKMLFLLRLKNCLIYSLHFELGQHPKFKNQLVKLFRGVKPTLFDVPNPPPLCQKEKGSPILLWFVALLRFLFFMKIKKHCKIKITYFSK